MVILTVVMPAFNEGTRIYKNILETVTQVEKFEKNFRIIVVNDGSSDETENEIKRAAARDKRIGVISYTPNHGKGYAVRRGMLAAKSEYVAFLDSDLELPPYLLESFLNKAESEEKDVVIGSKMHPDSQLEYPLVRKVLSFGYYMFLKLLFHFKMKDTQTGIKLFRTEQIRPALEKMQSAKFTFDIELLAIAQKLGLSIAEMPVVVNFSRNKSDKSKIHLKTVFDMFYETLRVKKRIKHLEI